MVVLGMVALGMVVLGLVVLGMVQVPITLNGFMLVNTQGLKIIKKKFQRDILKGKPINWHHFRPMLILAGQSF
jgi:hypothetical protein